MHKAGLDELKVKDVMSRNPITAAKTDKVSEVLGKMKTHGIHDIPIVEGTKVIGLVSYDHIMKRRGLPLTMEAENVMVIPPKVSEEDSVAKVAELLLNNDFKAIPVTSRDKKSELRGFVSRVDILRKVMAIEDFARMPINDVMTPSPVTVSEEEDIAKARHLMNELTEPTLPVIDKKERLVGVIGAKDLAVFLTMGPDSKASPKKTSDLKVERNVAVKSLMSTPAVSISPASTVRDAMHAMSEHGISSIVVAENERPIGIVTQWDLLETIAKFKEREQVYIQITGLKTGDNDMYDTIFSITEKSLKKISNLFKPEMLTLHIVEYHVEEKVPKWKLKAHKKKGREIDMGAIKYSVRARLSTEKQLFVGKSFDWDVYKAVDDVMTHLEIQAKKLAEKRKEIRPRVVKSGKIA